MPAPLPADLPAGSRVYRREGMRRLEPGELQVLKHASRDRWTDAAVLLGGLAISWGLLTVAWEQPSPYPGWLRGVAFTTLLFVFYFGIQAARVSARRSNLREDVKRGEVLRFVAEDPSGDQATQSVELLLSARMVWRRDEGPPLPPEIPWPLPGSIQLTEVLEITQRPLSAEERLLLPLRAQRERMGWTLSSLGITLFFLAAGVVTAIASAEVQKYLRSLVLPVFYFPIVLLFPRISWTRLQVAQAVAQDVAAGTIWLFRQIDPLITHGYRVPLTTTEVLPHSGLRWRDPYTEIRTALTPDERKIVKAR